MEKLHELHDEGGYDLIVIDTPPTRNALDFLDAPARITRLLNNKLFRLVMAPTRASFRVANFALQAFFRTVAKVIGKEVVEDLVLFFQAFEGMEEGFRQRATRVMQLLSDRPHRLRAGDGPGPGRRLRGRATSTTAWSRRGLRVNGLVVNRIHPEFGDAVASARLVGAVTDRPPTAWASSTPTWPTSSSCRNGSGATSRGWNGRSGRSRSCGCRCWRWRCATSPA